jgi:Type II CAAX prenyl endopeptidase Rce1-like
MRRHLEIAAVLLAAAVHFLLTQALGIKGLDIAPIGLGCIAYAIHRGRNPEARAAWGIRKTGLWACSRDVGWLIAAGTAFCAAFGLTHGTFAVDLHLLLPLLLYPLWGLAQQFLVLGLFAHNLDALGWPRPLVLGLTALGFAGVHVPDWPLCAATGVLGFTIAVLFFRHRNLWPLGLAHGLLGALFYRWVLGRDVWAELLQVLQ